MKGVIDRQGKVFMYTMEQNASSDSGGGGSGAVVAGEGGDNSQTAAAMTYANLETLTRLNTEDLTSILSSTNHQRDHAGTHTHYADSSATGDEPAGYIVSMATEASSAEAYGLDGQTNYVVDSGTGAEVGNDDCSGVDESATDNEASSLGVHTYCKTSLRVGHDRSVTAGAVVEDVDGSQVDAAGNAASLTDGVAVRSAELLDLKTVLPGPTTRRVLLIDDGHGDLEMAKSDVEFLLRGDAATIVLREGKRSEVWARFGKIFFQGRKIKGYVACRACNQVID